MRIRIKSITNPLKNILIFVSISVVVAGFIAGTVYLFYYIVQTNRKLYSILFLTMTVLSTGYFIYRGIKSRKIIGVLRGIARGLLIFFNLLFIMLTILLYGALLARNLKIGLILSPLYLLFFIYSIKVFRNTFFVKNLLKKLD